MGIFTMELNYIGFWNGVGLHSLCWKAVYVLLGEEFIWTAIRPFFLNRIGFCVMDRIKFLKFVLFKGTVLSYRNGFRSFCRVFSVFIWVSDLLDVIFLVE